MPLNVDPAGTTPDEIMIRSELDRLLASPEFRQSPQLSAFLNFVVDETLAGRGEQLKGYTIATLALGRPDEFDPQTDPIVRVQANRLRKALSEYYAGQSNEARPVKISLDRGSYRAVFGSSDMVESVQQVSPPAEALVALASTPSRPIGHPFTPRYLAYLGASVAAIGLLSAAWLLTERAGRNGDSARPTSPIASSPLAPSRTVQPIVVFRSVESGGPVSTDNSTMAMVPRIAAALSRFDDILAVNETAPTSGPLAERAPGAYDYVLAARVERQDANHDRLLIKLTHAASATIVWTREFDAIPQDESGNQMRDNILRSVATNLGRPFGIVFAHARRSGSPPGSTPDAYECGILAFDYWQQMNEPAHRQAVACLRHAREKAPNSSTIAAQLTFFEVEAYRQGFGGAGPEALERALILAALAVTRSPSSARAQQAVMAVQFVRRDYDEAMRAGDRALEMNPYDTDVIGDIGARYVQLDQVEKGLDLLNRSAALNPTLPVWHRYFQFLGLLRRGDLANAVTVGSAINRTDDPLFFSARVISAHLSGDRERQQGEIEALKKLSPDFVNSPVEFIRRRGFGYHMTNFLLETLRNAGIG